MKLTTHSHFLIVTTVLLLALGTPLLMAADSPTSTATASPVIEGPFKPEYGSFKQYQCPEWFRDAKFGIWAVWGVCSVPMQGDWYTRNMYIQPDTNNPDSLWSRQYQHHVDNYGHPSKSGLKDLMPLWKAEKWKPDELMALYKKAGAKYFFGLAVFCDNIDYWDSKYHQWNSVKMGPHRDIIGDWSKAARKQGLRFGVSEHWGDYPEWMKPCKGSDTAGPLAGVPYDGNDPAYADLYNTTPQPEDWLLRMNDLVDRYKPDLFYTDGIFPYADQTGRNFLSHYYNQGRLWHDGKDEVVYNCKQDSQGMWVEDLERGVMNEIKSNPWQTDTCIADWHYSESYLKEHKYRSTTMILQMLADIVSKNGNLLLNFPPKPDGTLDDDEFKILNELAAWMPVNGEAIFGTRPWKIFGEGPAKVKKSGGFNEQNLKYTAQDIRFTTKGKTLYALVLGWPEEGRVIVKSLATSAGKVGKVTLLGHAAMLDWKQTGEGLMVTMPAQKPCQHIFALKIEGDDFQPAPLPPTPAVPTVSVGPDASGNIKLTGTTVQIDGNSPIYSANIDQIGYWNNPEDFVFWNISVPKAGNYTINITYSCDAFYGGSEFAVEAGSSKLVGTSKSTGSWSTYASETLGEITLAEGRQTMALKPKTPPKWRVIGLRSIELKPTNK